MKKLLTLITLSLALNASALSPTSIINYLQAHKSWVLQQRLGQRGQHDTWLLRKSPNGNVVAHITSTEAKQAIQQGHLVLSKGFLVNNYRSVR